MGLLTTLPLVDSLADMVTAIFNRGLDKKKKKHAVRAAELKILIGNETAKPMSEWIHSDIEAWVRELDAIGAIAVAEVQAYANN